MRPPQIRVALASLAGVLDGMQACLHEPWEAGKILFLVPGSVSDNSLSCTASSVCSVQQAHLTPKKVKLCIITLCYALKQAFLPQCSSQKKIGCCSSDWRQRRADLTHAPYLWGSAVALPDITFMDQIKFELLCGTLPEFSSQASNAAGMAFSNHATFFFGYLLAPLLRALGMNTQLQECRLYGAQLNGQNYMVYITLDVRQTWVLISSLVPSGN